MTNLEKEKYFTLAKLSKRWDVPIRDLIRYWLLGTLEVKVWANEWSVERSSTSGSVAGRTVLLGPYEIEIKDIEPLLVDEQIPLHITHVQQDFTGYTLAQPQDIDRRDLVVAHWRVRMFEERYSIDPELVPRRKRGAEAIAQITKDVQNGDFLEKLKAIRQARVERRHAREVLSTWFKYDTWKYDDALLLLCGLDPKYSTTGEYENYYGVTLPTLEMLCDLDGDEYALDVINDKIAGEHLICTNAEWGRLRDIWRSGQHPNKNSPTFYIDWALSKGHSIPWLDIAMEEGLVPRKANSEEKLLSTRERNTVARIIAALSKEAKLKLDDPFKAAGILEKITEELGCRVGDDTIAKWLKEAAAQCEQRKK